MDNLIIIPESIRGLGNIVDKKGSSDFTTFNTNLFSTGSELINDTTRTVFQIEYENDQLYFLEFPTKVLSGVNQTITAMVKNSEGNPVNNATVRLYITSNNYVESTSNSQGILTFNNVNLSAGSYELYMIYNNIKSGKILIACVTLQTISVPDFIVTCKNQLLRVPITLYDDNNSPISEIPLTVDVQGNQYNLRTDETGTANYNEYVGNELGDVSAKITCGNTQKYFQINDCICYMYNGLYGTFTTSTCGLNLASIAFLTEGFKVSPNPYLYGTNIFGSNPDLESAFLFGKFTDVIVEFTYLSSYGNYGFNFLVADENNNRLFLMSYNPSTGKYNFITSNEDINVTGTLSSRDKFKIVFSNGNINCYKNNQSIYVGFTSSTSNMFIGFRSLPNTYAVYDKFMIKTNGINSLKSALINKGVTQLINNLTYENHVISYNTINVQDIDDLSDFNGVIYNLRKNDNGNIKFDVISDFEISWGIVESTKDKIEHAVTNLTYNSTTGDFNFSIVGDIDA